MYETFWLVSRAENKKLTLGVTKRIETGACSEDPLRIAFFDCLALFE